MLCLLQYDPYAAFGQRSESDAGKASSQSQTSAASTGPQPPVPAPQPGAGGAAYYGGMPPYNPYWAGSNRGCRCSFIRFISSLTDSPLAPSPPSIH